jgi:hypothetical protein
MTKVAHTELEQLENFKLLKYIMKGKICIDYEKYFVLENTTSKKLIAISKQKSDYINSLLKQYQSYSKIPNEQKINGIELIYNDILDCLEIQSVDENAFKLNELSAIWLKY